MKSLLLTIIAWVILIPSPRDARAQLIHEPGSEVTLDTLAGRYWYYDLVRFADMTYDEQIAEIETLTVEGFTGSWHMATYAEMQNLWNYSAEAIFSNFALTRDDAEHHQQYTLGRYDERYNESAHYFAYVGLTSDQTYEKTELNYMDRWSDEDDFDVLGAWAVYEGEPPHQLEPEPVEPDCSVTDPDSDGDGARDCMDNCPDTYNPEQLDSDGDGVGDICEDEAVATVWSTLGNDPKPYRTDKDVFIFYGTKGEEIRIRLESNPPESGLGKLASLILRNARGLRPFQTRRSRLPHEIAMTLPVSGEFCVIVAEQPKWATPWGKRYTGDYCITFQASPETCQTFVPADSVE